MTPDQDRSTAFALLSKQVRECVLCPRMSTSCRILGLSSGQLFAPLMFVGEAPGRLGADDTAIPFHGDRAGENFEKLIAQVGISRYDCFITNAVLCNPKDEKGNNATPLRQEVNNCSAFLRAQIDLINPKLVVSLGNLALQALKVIEPHSFELSTDVRTANNWRGRILIPLYHPGQRAMLHRSFLNQLSDYRFVSEQLKRLTKSTARAIGRGKTNAVAANVVRSILHATGAISYFRLHKLFYLLEYHHVRTTARRLTNSYAIRQKDGPYFTDLHISKLKRALPDLKITTKGSTMWLALEQRSDLFGDASHVTSDLQKFVDSVVDRYRHRTDEALKTAVYLTAPMRRLLRKEKYQGADMFNAPIDFLATEPPARNRSTFGAPSK